MNLHVLLFGLSAFLRIAVHLAILMVAIRQRRNHPRASFLVVTGTILLLFSDVGGQAFQMAAVRIWSPNSLPLVLGGLGLCMTCLTLAAIVLFVVAAFGPKGPNEGYPSDFSPNAEAAPLPSRNPYESPQ